MDFTLLFLIILMLLAVQSNLTGIAILLGILILFTSMKNKYLLLASIIGIAVVAAVRIWDLGEQFWLIGGGLFVIIILLAQKDSDQPAGGYYPGGGMG